MMEAVNFRFLYRDLEDPEQLIKWCMKVGLIANEYKCCKCDSIMKLHPKKTTTDQYVWRCRKADHDCRRSLRKGSWFESSRLSILNILLLTHMWCMKANMTHIRNELMLSTKTIVEWKNFCREVCVQLLTSESEMLGGEGMEVEIDENNFGKMKFRGKIVEGRWVFGGVERGSNKCFMVVVEKRKKDELLNALRNYIKPGTTVLSRCWKMYDCLEDEGFKFLAVNQSIIFKDWDAVPSTDNSERIWATVKQQVGKNHSQDQFDSHLFEYMWRRKYKQANLSLTNLFLEGVARIYSPSVSDE